MKIKFPCSTFAAQSVCLKLFLVAGLLTTSHLRTFSKAPFESDLTRFDFFYAGEAKTETMYMVQKGQITWSYTHSGKGEISDAVMLSNKHILFAHQFGITEITPDKKVVWNYDTPQGCEIHTAQPIGKKHILFVQNGNPAKIIVINKLTGDIVKELEIPVGNPNEIHGQFRNARLTSKGTLLVAHMDMGKVCEYDANGKQLLSVDAPGVWSAQPLKNGNMLITCNNLLREVNPTLETVWEYALSANQEPAISAPQKALRLANGNTIVNNWFNQWNGTVDRNNQPIQAIEITPEKKVVWILKAWNNPDLGPSTTIIPLKEPHTDEHVFFGDIH